MAELKLNAKEPTEISEVEYLKDTEIVCRRHVLNSAMCNYYCLRLEFHGNFLGP